MTLRFVPPPRDCFLHEIEYVGFKFGAKRWRAEGRLYTWDDFHGHVEGFNARGDHVGVFDCTGRKIGEAKKGRTIDV